MALLQSIVTVLLFALAVFLIVLILIQRGKGGGLAGAFGGMGGQSAFGTKAGDLFTRITIGVATVWILLCIVSVRLYSVGSSRIDLGDGTPVQQQSQIPGSGGEDTASPSPSSSAPAESPGSSSPAAK